MLGYDNSCDPKFRSFCNISNNFWYIILYFEQVYVFTEIFQEFENCWKFWNLKSLSSLAMHVIPNFFVRFTLLTVSELSANLRVFFKFSENFEIFVILFCEHWPCKWSIISVHYALSLKVLEISTYLYCCAHVTLPGDLSIDKDGEKRGGIEMSYWNTFIIKSLSMEWRES